MAAKPHTHWKTGEPCNCGFTSHLDGQVSSNKAPEESWEFYGRNSDPEDKGPARPCTTEKQSQETVLGSQASAPKTAPEPQEGFDRTIPESRWKWPQEGR